MAKILIVEDNKVMRVLLTTTLQTYGYDIIVAENGLEGVKQASSEYPDLILMDIMMPVMDGIKAIQQIMVNPTLIKIPIVVLSAVNLEERVSQAFEAGAKAFITKPWKTRDLIYIISSLI